MSQTRRLFKIQGMHCTSCAMSVDFALEDLEGVTAAHTSYADATADVTYDETRLDEARIVAAITAAGYAAQPA